MSGTGDALKPFIAKAASAALSEDDARAAFDILMSGDASPAQIGGFLMALRTRGETVAEITGAARVMREKVLPVAAPSGAIDIVGTGGDGHQTYNISTAAAIVAAACGLKVAKHGNRAASSKSGTADALEALGVNLDIPPEKISHCIAQAGIGFMFARAHHAAMKHVAPYRVELGTRTIFNLLGPLSNPANAKYYLLGVYSQDWVKPMAEVLKNLGAKAAWIVHGEDGLDELSTTGPSHVAQLKDGAITTFTVRPEDAHLPIATLSDLRGGNPDENAAKILALLDGERSSYRDIVVFNSAAALMVAGKAECLLDGVTLAGEQIDNGAALTVLQKLVDISNS